MPAAQDDWRRMGQERYLLRAKLERRPYSRPDREGLRAWRSTSRGVVVQGFASSPPSAGIFATPDSADDWEEIPPPHPMDHDHCEFCGAKFVEQGAPGDQEALTEGFVTADAEGRDRWICDGCFADFENEFEWSVAGT